MLAAASQVNYLLSAMNPQSLYGADALRCLFYAVLLLGSMREIWSYWHALSKAAVLQERQRIACELHDGVAQELAYLARNLECAGRIRRTRTAWTDCAGPWSARGWNPARVISAAAAPGSQPFEVGARRSRDRGRRALSRQARPRYHLRHPVAGPAARSVRADRLRSSCQRRPA